MINDSKSDNRCIVLSKRLKWIKRIYDAGIQTVQTVTTPYIVNLEVTNTTALKVLK